MDSFTVPTSFSPSSFTYQWTYDVFLSFRGEDTRSGFTGNLYSSLSEKGINAFIDDQELRKGEEITPALVKAIQEARIAIVVFSQNYASSTFCLEELEKIMECNKHKGRLVWPVFYQVDPSDVRHQKGSYGEALAKHESRICDKEKLKRWRFALNKAANLSGWHFQLGYEYELIRKITQEISKRISRVPLYVANYPVGLDSRVLKVNSLLDAESNDEVHMVGIYGIGGIGKTTLACAVYNFIADQFESLCFLADIRENSVKHGLVQLQEKLLYDLVGEKDIKAGSVNRGIPIIKNRLCGKKILLILDDVDKLEQLKALAGGHDWFGSGSRVIIITRDKHLLHVSGVERTYEVEGLNHKEAMELFSWSAFKRKEVEPTYVDISERVILYSNGFPLSLEVMGSDLFGKTVSEWKSALDIYERIPHKSIQGLLRVSYDGLQEFEKEIFLDLACFFNGYELTDVINILNSGRGYAPDYVIQVLVDKCLTKIVDCRVRMHNLIEDMGREIVRQESPSNPGERSRLWFSKDILRVFKENKGTDKIEFIMLHLHKDKEVQWNGNALKKMKNLKILVIENGRFSRGPSYLPKRLRVLKWCGYPDPSLPANFDPKKLVILDFSMSLFSFKDEPIVKFKSLTEMKLSGCQLLYQVPDLSGSPSLKKLHLDCCKNLVEVHDSIGFLEKLEDLNLNYCSSLKVLPPGIFLTSLKTLSLAYCTSLESFPEILGKMENTRFLCLNYSAVRELPFSIGNLVGLTTLSLECCNRLLELPSSILTLPKLENLQVRQCVGLGLIENGKYQEQETSSSGVRDISCFWVERVADFGACSLTDMFLAKLLPSLRYVTKLSLRENNITIIPSSIKACHCLRTLSLNNCKELREIRGLPPNLSNLSAINCTALTCQSKEMLLTEALHRTGGMIFRFPCPGSTVQDLFHHHCSNEPSLSFWFRKKFPVITLGIVEFSGFYPRFELDLIINGSLWFPQFFIVRNSIYYQLKTNHITLVDLQLKFCNTKFRRLLTENGWNHAEILLTQNAKSELEWMGIHINEQSTSMTDIRFTNPDPVPPNPVVIAEENKRVIRRYKRSQKDVKSSGYV